MAEKSSEKQEKIEFSSLPSKEINIYYERAEYLLDKGYVENKSVHELAKELYDAKWRK